MSERQSKPDDPSQTGVRHAWHYAMRLFGQFTVWLSAIFLLVDGATALSKRPFSFLPNWLDSGLEIAPWVLWVGIGIGGYRIFFDQQIAFEAKLADVNGKLMTYEAAKPNVTVGLVGNNGISNSHDLRIGQFRPLPDLDSKERYWRKRSAVAYQEMERKYDMPYSFGSGPRLRDKEEYGNDINEYVKDMRLYQHAKHHYATAKACVRPIAVSLGNKGTSSARGITIEIELPPNVRVATEDEVDWYNDKDGDFEPGEPDPPTATYYPFLSFPNYTAGNPYIYSSEPTEPNDQRGPHFVPRQGRTFVIYKGIPVVSAGQSVDDLEPFYLMFNQIEQDTELALNVSVFADALREPKVIMLHLAVRLTEEMTENVA